MNYAGIAAGLAALAFFLTPASRKLVKGHKYLATFKLPVALLQLPNLGGVAKILPPDGVLRLNERLQLEVLFTALRDEEIGDIQTALGPVKFVQLREVRD